MAGITDGITGIQGDAENAVRGAAEKIMAALRAALGVEEGPSSITQGYGSQVAQGLADGLKEVDSGQFDAGAKAMMDAVAQAIDRAFQVENTGWFGSGGATASRFAPVGAAVCKAIADGIRSNNENKQARRYIQLEYQKILLAAQRRLNGRLIALKRHRKRSGFFRRS